MRQRFLLLCCCLLAALGLGAQTLTLSGTVTDDENGQPLANVIVMLKEADGKAILQYTRTNAQGAYSLPTTTMQARLLSFTLMGYEAKEVPLAPDRQTYAVSLRSKAIQIREVVVKAPKIRTKGDTIVYNVSRFAEEKDKSLGDVLRKMPGIEVAKSGTVSYNGKAINKFYIEGMDMLEGRYGIATNSLSQKDVRSVEVLENHQPIKALEKTTFSEQAALNVKLKKEARARWLATLQAGGGIDPTLWKGDLSLMRFKGKSQQMFTYKGNNTGEEVTGGHRRLTAEEVISGMGGGYNLTSYVGLHTHDAPNLGEERTLFNRSHTFSSNLLFKLGKEYQLTTRMLYANDRRTSEYASRTEYFLADSLIVTAAEDDTRTRSEALTAEATLQANTSAYYLKNTLAADLSWERGDALLEGSYPNRQHTSTRDLKLSNRLQWVKNIGRRTLTVTSQNSYQRHPERLTVSRSSGRQGQRLRSSAFFTQTTLSHAWNLYPFSLTLNGGVAGVWRTLDSRLEGVPDTLGILSFADKPGYWHLFASPRLQYKEDDWVVTLDAPLHYYSSLGKGYASPRLYIRRELTAHWEGTLSGQFSFAPTADGNRYTGLVLRNYRTLYQGQSDVERTASRSASFYLDYKDPIHALFGNVRLSYSHTRNPYQTAQSFVGDYIVVGYLPQTTKGEVYRASGRISKGVDFWELVGTLSASYSDSHQQMRQNGVLQPYRAATWSADFMLTARPARWCSTEYKLSYHNNRLRSEANTSSTDNLYQSLTLTLSAGSRWRMDVAGEHYRNALARERTKQFFLLDASLAYNLSASCELSLQLRNLLNEERYAYTLYSGLSCSYSEYLIRPRNLLLSVYYKF